MSNTSLQYHIAFSTKERRRFLDPQIMPRLVSYIGGTIRGLGGTLLDANGPDDHIHLPTARTTDPPFRSASSQLCE
jgi:REP element-mobilizing transposase RayT